MLTMMVKVGEDLRERTRSTRDREDDGSGNSVGVARRSNARGKCDNNDSDELEHVSLLWYEGVSAALMTQLYTPLLTNATARSKILKTWNNGCYKLSSCPAPGESETVLLGDICTRVNPTRLTRSSLVAVTLILHRPNDGSDNKEDDVSREEDTDDPHQNYSVHISLL
jgi:hypothetical protein